MKSKQFQIEGNFHHGLQQHVDSETWSNGAIKSQVSFESDFDWIVFCLFLFLISESTLELLAHKTRFAMGRAPPCVKI